MKNLQKKLIDRFDLGEVPSKGIWFKIIGEEKWSILNIGKLMSSSPYKWTGFDGWEAMDKNHKIIREQTLEKLLNLLT